MSSVHLLPHSKCDVLIIGAGIIGLSIGNALLESRPDLKVFVADKEAVLGTHASGRNSGVLHAGFYYSPDSLKARFCREGNIDLRNLCKKYSIQVRNVGKVVVTKNELEEYQLDQLYNRGIQNGVALEILDSNLLSKYEPLAKTYRRFLWSPTTGVSDPSAVISSMAREFESKGGRIIFDSHIQLELVNQEIRLKNQMLQFSYLINAAGAQADRIYRSLGISLEYAILPFIGLYRVTQERNLPLRTLVYPVPHPLNPFLGVHFTLTVDNKVKIGPTAIPIVGREQYSITTGWSIQDMHDIAKATKALINGDSHDFSSIVKAELPKFLKSKILKESQLLVPGVKNVKNWLKKPPGIRAQLVHVPSGKLEQDFLIKNYLNSTHVLNAVSPGWTSSIPFARYVVNLVHNKI